MAGGLQQGLAIGAAVEIAAVGGELPKRVRLFPAFGRWQGKNGNGPYEITDRAAAERIVAATQAYQAGTKLMVDYDHQVPLAVASGAGGTAIAAGWLGELIVEDDGIYAVVEEWTAAASARLRAREYRYVSPFFTHDKQGHVTRIVNAALTNTPNFELGAIAASHPSQEAQLNGLEAIAAALGLPAGATLDQAIAAINGLKAAKSNLTATASALGLGSDAEGSAIATGAAALKARADAGPDPAKFVPVSVADDLRDRLGLIEAERGDAAIAAAIKVGKLAPAEKAWALGYYKEKGPADFASMLANRPVILNPGELERPDEAAAGGSALTAEDKAIASAMGWSEEDMLAQRKLEKGAK